ncbi:hypothetical protein WOLCODRAFT_158719 [Wolfiporia cocos MD-104 SS10]|uniref:Uncharacterized protein n=1 Tax=Wolfiporia cocos (strain MD-104) TaxID=742152 RepID=A0A2H3JAB7_WOLCO|nr:hypothetical protein WOLCODRAFT_158719 [Wolfiporia cocos MD-104 SS10]
MHPAPPGSNKATPANPVVHQRKAKRQGQPPESQRHSRKTASQTPLTAKSQQGKALSHQGNPPHTNVEWRRRPPQQPCLFPACHSNGLVNQGVQQHNADRQRQWGGWADTLKTPARPGGPTGHEHQCRIVMETLHVDCGSFLHGLDET